MHLFENGFQAFEFAVEVRSAMHSPRSNDIERMGGAARGLMNSQATAIDVWRIVEKHDIRTRCRGSWFMAWAMPEPTQERANFAPEEERRLQDAWANYEDALADKGLIPPKRWSKR